MPDRSTRTHDHLGRRIADDGTVWNALYLCRMDAPHPDAAAPFRDDLRWWLSLPLKILAYTLVCVLMLLLPALLLAPFW